jgi:type VI secretion system protein ImpA
MPLSDLLDPEMFRSPLPGDAPGGVNLDEPGDAHNRWRKVVDAFREARSVERRAEQGSLGNNDPAPKRADALPLWRTIGEESLAILNGVARDLRVAQYLIMSLVRTEGFAGLATGCRVTRALVEAHWPILGPFPEPDEVDAFQEAVRVQPLLDLAGGDQGGLLEDPIRHVPLLAGCPWGRFGLAVLPGGEPSAAVAEDFPTAKSATTLKFFQEIHVGVSEARTAWSELADAVHAAAEGRVSLPRSTVAELLDNCRMAIETLADGRLVQPATAGSQDPDESAEWLTPASDGTHPRGGLVGQPSTREDALRCLDSVAKFFESQDPHSLLAAQVRHVVRMGRMKQADYLRELIRDKPALEQLSRYAGIDFGDPGGEVG